MNRHGKMSSIPDTSLRTPQSANRFAARWMEEQQRRDIGKRLWELREASPHTNRSVGDAVGVSERTVAEWVAGRQGITYDHATAVAQLFEVDLDWFWNGRQEATPDLMGQLSPADADAIREQLDRIEAALEELTAEREAAVEEQAATRESEQAKQRRAGRQQRATGS